MLAPLLCYSVKKTIAKTPMGKKNYIYKTLTFFGKLESFPLVLKRKWKAFQRKEKSRKDFPKIYGKCNSLGKTIHLLCPPTTKIENQLQNFKQARNIFTNFVFLSNKKMEKGGDASQCAKGWGLGIGTNK